MIIDTSSMIAALLTKPINEKPALLTKPINEKPAYNPKPSWLYRTIMTFLVSMIIVFCLALVYCMYLLVRCCT